MTGCGNDEQEQAAGDCIRVSDIGEFALIDRLAAIARHSSDHSVILGIGDDAAIVKPGSSIIVLTSDMLVDGVHFDSAHQPFASIGHRAMAANISDVAAMAARPRYALVCLGLPGESHVAEIEELYEGLVGFASRFGVAVVGGDVVSSPNIVISVALMGCAADELGARRSSAKAGDKIIVTGHLGRSAAGLFAGRLPQDEITDLDAGMIAAHLFPEPRLAAALAALSAGARCMQDVSDGFVKDLGHICQESSLGAMVELSKLPLDKGLRDFCASHHLGAEKLLLAGGEDFELIITCPPEISGRVVQAINEVDPAGASVVGYMTSECRGVYLEDEDGSRRQPSEKGWEHFVSEP